MVRPSATGRRRPVGATFFWVRDRSLLSGRVADGQQAYKDPAVGGQRIYRSSAPAATARRAKGPRIIRGRSRATGRSPSSPSSSPRRCPRTTPGRASATDAEKVAAYIYEAFYSKTAQARNTAARIELSRLTVRQYRNAVADLIGSFREPGNWDDAPRAATASTSSRAGSATATASSSGSTPRSGSTSARTSPDPEKIDAERVLDPLGRVGAGPGDGRVRVHRPHRARHPALGQRHRTGR